MVDTGCSRSIISRGLVQAVGIRTSPISEGIVMMNGDTSKCTERVDIDISMNGTSLQLDCLVSPIIPGVDMLIGMDAISRFGGLKVTREGEVVLFGKEAVGAASAVRATIRIEDIDTEDFTASFDGSWTVRWKWKDGPPKLSNQIAEYKVPDGARSDYEAEIEDWIKRGWLVPYEGEYDGLIPLMAVVQVNKDKVRPVLDYRELNQFVSSHTAHGDVCSAKLRDWRKRGDELSLVDLRRAYLQIGVDESLWRYQVVSYKGKTYALTRLGFGLNVAPRVMTSILSRVLDADAIIREGTDSYIDDVIVSNEIVSPDEVIAHLGKFGLEAKPPAALEGSRVLGLHVERKDGELWWDRGKTVELPDRVMTRRQVFAWYGQLVAHFPVVAWLRPVCSFLKRATNGLQWDQLVDEKVMHMIRDTHRRVIREDPATGVWRVPHAARAQVWCDASSLALGVCIEVADQCIEDATWLRKECDGSHINLAELEAVVKGISLATQWNFSDLEVITDSATVYGWLRSLLAGDKPVRTKGLGEALVKRRLSLVADLVAEFALKVEVRFVRSESNKADKLTRVPRLWLEKEAWCAVAELESVSGSIQRSHEQHHFGVDRTLAVLNLEAPEAQVNRRDVETVVKACERCNSIDPASVRFVHGELGVESIWSRLAADVTHVNGQAFLTIIDCGPSRFTIWRRLKSESASEIAVLFEQVFCEWGPPEELLLDNGAAFTSEHMRELCAQWGVDRVFRNAHRPQGNGIIENCHRSVKRTVARAGCTVANAVFWRNLAPRSRAPPPCFQMFSRGWRPPRKRNRTRSPETHHWIGREVFVKPGGARCNTTWKRGRVTGWRPPATFEVNGIPRHVSDVRLAQCDATPEMTDQDSPPGPSDDTPLLEATGRGMRAKKPPAWFSDYVDFSSTSSSGEE